MEIEKRNLFGRPVEGIRQIQVQRAVGYGRKVPKVFQVIIGLFVHAPIFADIELIITPTAVGMNIGIPKWCMGSTCLLKRVYKKPSGSVELQFEFQKKLVIRRERKLRPHECLLEHKSD